MSCGDRPKEVAPHRQSSASSVPGKSSDMAPNVLLITVDTTRADHLGCYGYSHVKTPAIDGLADEGVLFEEAFAAQPVTLPAHCSIHTGKYPFRHGVRDNNIYELSKQNQTLAEVLSARGYLSTAFVASYILNHRFGLSQGFHFYNDRFVKPKQKGRLPVDRRASEVSFLATEWLREMNTELNHRPFFLWLHYYDPHADYNPPHPYKTAYGNPYDGEIAYMDDWLGYFFDELKKRGKWDNTMVVLVGDHGEGFGDHGESTHGMFIYRATTHVPMVMKFPAGEYAGTRVPYRVSQVDIFPTILSELSLKGSDEIDGRSLQPLIRGEEKSHRDTYSEVYIPRSFHWSELHGLRTKDDFYIQAPGPEYYHLDADPFEKENRYSEETESAKQIAKRLRNMTVDVASVKTGKVAMSDEMAKRLEALGYFVAEDGPFEDTTELLPDPKERIAAFNAHQRANNFAEEGRIAEALQVYAQLVENDPKNVRFLMELANLHVNNEDYDAAEKMYLRAVQIEPHHIRLLTLVGTLYRLWHKPGKAIEFYQRALNENNDDFLPHFHLASVYLAQKEYALAKQHLKKAVTIRRDAAAFNNLGYIAIQVDGQFELGVRYIQKAVQSAINKAPYLYSLGVAYRDHGRLSDARTTLSQAVTLVPDDLEYIAALEGVCRTMGDAVEAERLAARRALLTRSN